MFQGLQVRSTGLPTPDVPDTADHAPHSASAAPLTSALPTSRPANGPRSKRRLRAPAPPLAAPTRAPSHPRRAPRVPATSMATAAARLRRQKAPIPPNSTLNSSLATTTIYPAVQPPPGPTRRRRRPTCLPAMAMTRLALRPPPTSKALPKSPHTSRRGCASWTSLNRSTRVRAKACLPRPPG